MRDLTEQRFGMLVALCETDARKHGYVVWKCKCDCGNYIAVSSIDLLKGRKRSCGCMRTAWDMILREQYKKDITGQTFGILTAIRPTEKRKNRSVVWECWCDCGNTVFESVINLTAGNRRSCGCQHKAHIAQYGASRAKDLTGQRFGRLVAVRPTERRSGNAIVWECVCDCGKTAFASRNSLVNGTTSSCGCLRKEMITELNNSRGKDLSGKRFGRLTALEPTAQRKDHRVVWRCRCDCGNVVYVKSSNLLSGKTKSCGCIQRSKSKGSYEDLGSIESKA